jgi:hypothetical protein
VVLPTLLLLLVGLGSELLLGGLMSLAGLLLLLTASTVWRRALHPELLVVYAPAASAVRRLSTRLLLLLYRTPPACEAPQPLLDLVEVLLVRFFLLAAALCFLLGLGLLLRPCLLLLLPPLPEAPVLLALLPLLIKLLCSFPAPALVLSLLPAEAAALHAAAAAAAAVPTGLPRYGDG